MSTYKEPSLSIDLGFAPGVQAGTPISLSQLLVGLQTQVLSGTNVGKIVPYENGGTYQTYAEFDSGLTNVADFHGLLSAASDTLAVDADNKRAMSKVLNMVYVDRSTYNSVVPSGLVDGKSNLSLPYLRAYFTHLSDKIDLPISTTDMSVDFSAVPIVYTSSAWTQAAGASYTVENHSGYIKVTENSATPVDPAIPNGSLVIIVVDSSVYLTVSFYDNGTDTVYLSPTGGVPPTTFTSLSMYYASSYFTEAYISGETSNDINFTTNTATISTGLEIQAGDIIEFFDATPTSLGFGEVTSYNSSTGALTFITGGVSGTAATMSFYYNPLNQNIYLEGIAVDTSNALTIREVNSSTVSGFGDNSILNPLGYAANLSVGSGHRVYAISVQNPSDYTAAQSIIDNHDEYTFLYYHILHTTEDKNWVSYVEAKADKAVMKWGFIPIYNPIPGEYETIATEAAEGNWSVANNILTSTAADFGSVQIGDVVCTTDSSEGGPDTTPANTVTVVSLIDDYNVGISDTISDPDYIVRQLTKSQRASLTATNASGYGSPYVWASPNEPVVTYNGSDVSLGAQYLWIAHVKTYSVIPVRRPKRGHTVTVFKNVGTMNGYYSPDDITTMESGGNCVYKNISDYSAMTYDGLTTDMTSDAKMRQAPMLQSVYFMYAIKSQFANMMTTGGYMISEAPDVIKSAFQSIYNTAVKATEPLVGRGTKITSLTPDGADGYIVDVAVETQKGFNYLSFVATAE